MNLLKLPKNTQGRDFVIGDIHGNFSSVNAELEKLNFNTECDRLISVGDLVDRGPESHHVLDWLDYDWFYAVCGNHEDMAIRFPKGNMDESNYAMNGGLWFIALNERDQTAIADALSELPIGIEVETDNGRVGIIHAEVPNGDWLRVNESMTRKEKSSSMWMRDKITNMDDSFVANIDRVFVGHTPLNNIETLGNVTYIDTAGWHHMGRFTVIKIQG